MLNLDPNNVRRSYPQTRDYILTWFDPRLREGETLPTFPPLPQAIVFLCGQCEKCPDTGKLHWQLYLHLLRRLRMRPTKSLLVSYLGDDASSTHLEPMRGTREECIAYVTKVDTYYGGSFQLGDIPTEQRDGRELIHAFRNGATLLSLPQDPSWDALFLRYSLSRISEMYALFGKSRRDPATALLCELHYGPPGTGKTRGVFSAFPEAYLKPSGDWWDHYLGQTHVIMDDFDGCFCTFGQFKRILDRYPLLIPVKGGFTNILASHFLITTNVYPSHWWSKKTTGQDGRDAIWRRLTSVHLYNLDGTVEVMSPSDLRARHMFDLEPLDPKEK